MLSLHLELLHLPLIQGPSIPFQRAGVRQWQIVMRDGGRGWRFITANKKHGAAGEYMEGEGGGAPEQGTVPCSRADHQFPYQVLKLFASEEDAKEYGGINKVCIQAVRPFLIITFAKLWV